MKLKPFNYQWRTISYMLDRETRTGGAASLHWVEIGLPENPGGLGGWVGGWMQGPCLLLLVSLPEGVHQHSSSSRQMCLHSQPPKHRDAKLPAPLTLCWPLQAVLELHAWCSDEAPGVLIPQLTTMPRPALSCCDHCAEVKCWVSPFLNQIRVCISKLEMEQSLGALGGAGWVALDTGIGKTACAGFFFVFGGGWTRLSRLGGVHASTGIGGGGLTAGQGSVGRAQLPAQVLVEAKHAE